MQPWHCTGFVIRNAWNSLPSYLRHDINYEQLMQELKSFLFKS